MEMKGIDLTKCNNCLFRAVYYGRPVSGTVKVGEEWCNLIFDGGIVSVRVSGLLEDSGITDFEIIPRDPETYRDWQVGDKVCKDERRNACQEVIFRSGELVVMKTNANTACSNYTCNELFRCGYRLVLTDIEQQIIEERKKYEPKDGDVVAWKDEEDDGNPAVSIYKEGNRGYATIFSNGLTMEYSIYAIFDMNIIRPATEEEKQKLFDAMAKEGKRWNAEKKIVEDIPKPYEFRKGEPVLARNGSFEKWCIAAYCKPEGTTNRVFVGEAEAFFVEVIPYNERTMRLLGTTKDYKEE